MSAAVKKPAKKAPAKKDGAELKVVIPALEMHRIEVNIVGLSPLLVDRLGPHVLEQILQKQTRQADPGRGVREPWVDFCNSLYWKSKRPSEPTAKDVERAVFGLPVRAFKKAAIASLTVIGRNNITKTLGQQALHVLAEKGEPLVSLKGSVPVMQEDFVRPNGRGGDLRFRGRFDQWSCTLTLLYNARAMTQAQIVNLLKTAGTSVGVGAWRVEKNGSYGMFDVVSARNVRG